MKPLATALAAAALLASTAPVGAQAYRPAAPYPPGPGYPPAIGSGSMTDYPVHMPSDFVADRLNAEELRNLDRAGDIAAMPYGYPYPGAPQPYSWGYPPPAAPYPPPG